MVPTLKDDPSQAVLASHRLMLRAGLIYQVASGIYGWWPMGLRILQNVAEVIRRYHTDHGVDEFLLPTVQPADLWRKSQRFEAYGPEMLTMQDRHHRDLVYGPTAEEAVTDMMRSFARSYKDLPKVLFNIQWKFRDEIRPRFGVMRGREFLMKDAYSFDVSVDQAKKTYTQMSDLYWKIFHALGLKVLRLRADTGPIGGDLSHEFHVISHVGESQIYYDARLGDAPEQGEFYAATEELHNPQAFQNRNIVSSKSIEVGHLFFFGDKYSQPLDGKVLMPSGDLQPYMMGSYGLGISRIVGAMAELFHDDKGLRWPLDIAPYQVGVVPIHADTCAEIAQGFYHKLQNQGYGCLLDDRDKSAGEKFFDLDLLGIPFQIRLSKRLCAQECAEIYARYEGCTQIVPWDNLIPALESLIETERKRYPFV